MHDKSLLSIEELIIDISSFQHTRVIIGTDNDSKLKNSQELPCYCHKCSNLTTDNENMIH